MPVHDRSPLALFLGAALALTVLLSLTACGEPEPEAPAPVAEAAPDTTPTARAEPAAEAVPPQQPPTPLLAPVAEATPEPEPEERPAARRRADRPTADATPRSKQRRSKKARGKKGGLQVQELLIAREVRDRAPIQPSLQYTTDSKQVWAWTRLENEGAPTHITMVWKHRTVEKNRIKLNVGTSDNWRTWSRRHISPQDAGAWQVEIRDADNRLLEVMEFWVKPSKKTSKRNG